jgi:hypothetical protein
MSDLVHPMMAGISNDPTNAVATTVNSEAQYAAGTGSGVALKYAVKLPNLLTGSTVASADVILKKSRTEVKVEAAV